MTIAFGAIGAKSAGGTTSVNVAYPASVGAEDQLIIADTGWPSSAGVNAISGWSVSQQGGGTGTAADAHTTTVAGFRKIAAGGETGSVAVGRGGTPTGQLGVMLRYTKTTDNWDAVAVASGSDNSHGSNRSVTTGNLDVAPGDMLVIKVGVDTDASLTVSAALTATGITFDTVNRRTSGAGVTTGEDGNIEVFDVLVTAGSGSVPITVTLTTGTSQCGPVLITRLREVPDSPPPSGDFVGFGVPL